MAIFLAQKRLPQALTASVTATVCPTMGLHMLVGLRLLHLLGAGGGKERKRSKVFLMRIASFFFGVGCLFLMLMAVCFEGSRGKEGLMLMVLATVCMLTAAGTFCIRALLLSLGLFEDDEGKGDALPEHFVRLFS